jgi:hypothetical protein
MRAVSRRSRAEDTYAVAVSDFAAVKQRSEETARRLGYPTLDSLPLIWGKDEPLPQMRSTEAVADRTLALGVVIASTFGLPLERARELVNRERLEASLAATEREYVAGREELGTELQVRIEALWALVWALGLVPDLDFTDYCGDNLVRLLPDLKVGEPLGPFRQRTDLRPVEEILEAADLAFRLHWAVADAALHGREPPGKVMPYVVVERRHALDWIFDPEADWDEMSLDT